jgi:hypothetical protein
MKVTVALILFIALFATVANAKVCCKAKGIKKTMLYNKCPPQQRRVKNCRCNGGCPKRTPPAKKTEPTPEPTPVKEDPIPEPETEPTPPGPQPCPESVDSCPEGEKKVKKPGVYWNDEPMKAAGRRLLSKALPPNAMLEKCGYVYICVKDDSAKEEEEPEPNASEELEKDKKKGPAGPLKTGSKVVDKSGILLKRCRKDGVTVDECCAKLGPKDHELYKGKDNMCCAKTIGMWLPPADEKNKGTWCGIKRQTDLVAGNLEGLTQLSKTLREELTKLHNAKVRKKQELMTNYVQHEKKEKGKANEAAEQQQLMSATKIEYKEKEGLVNRSANEYDELMTNYKEVKKNMEAQEQIEQDKLTKAVISLNLLQKMMKAKQKEIKEEIEALDKCNGEKDDEKSGYNKLNAEFRAIQKESDMIDAAINKADDERKAIDTKRKEKIKKGEADLAAINAQKKKFREDAVNAKKEFLAVREELKKAQDSFEQDLLSGSSVFLQVSDPIDAKCEGLCKQFANMEVSNGKFFDTADEFLKHASQSTSSLFKTLTAVHGRLLKLLKEDKDLHDKIMQKLEAKIRGLKQAIENLQKKIEDLTKEADDINKKTQASKKEMEDWTKEQNIKIGKIQRQLAKNMEKIKTANNRMEGLTSQITRLLAANTKCKTALDAMKTRTAALKEKKDAAEKQLAASKIVLEDSEDAVQTAKEIDEAESTRLSNDIKKAQEESAAFETDATKFKKAKISYKKKIAAFQEDEEEILQKDVKEKEEEKKPGFWSRMWNGAKKIGGKVVAGAKHVGKKVVAGAKHVGKKVVAGVKHVGKKVKGLFSKKKKEETTTTTDEEEDEDKKEETTSTTTTTEEDKDEDEPTPTRRATRRVTTKIGGASKDSKKARYELYADACKSATTKKSECNILTFNDLVDKGYKTKVASAKRTRVACVWKRDACRPKVKRKTNLRANTPMKFGKEEATVQRRL